MSNSDDDSRYLNERLHKNQVTTAVVAAALVGFVGAAYLGAFSSTSLKELPPWISALTAAVATLISAYAVYLVAQTLKATRETLDATRQMAEDQKRIGDAQIRPWVLVDGFSLNYGVFGNGFRVAFRNYGVSPAAIPSFRVNIDCYEYTDNEFIEYNEDGSERDYLGEWEGGCFSDDYLVPGGVRLVTGWFADDELPEGVNYMNLRIEWDYSDLTHESQAGKYSEHLLRSVTLTGRTLELDDTADSLLKSWESLTP